MRSPSLPDLRVLLARLTLLVASALACAPRAARAQDGAALVLAVGGDAAPEARDEAADAVRAALAAQGLAPIDEAELAARVPPSRRRAVGTLDEARALAFDLGARVLVSVTRWRGAASDAPDELALSLLSDGRSFTATAPAPASTLRAAVDALVARLLAERTEALIALGPPAASSARAARPEEHAGDAAPDDAEAPVASAPRAQVDGPDVVAPTMLAAAGLAGIGLGAYALLDEVCQLRAASGTCLRGEGPNVPTGVTLVAAGGLAAIGAVVWFVAGVSSTPTMAPVDVVVLPGGGAIVGRGTF